MALIRIVFAWVVFCIIYFGLKWIKEKKKEKIFKARMKNYNKPLGMSVGKRIEFKRGYRKI